MLSLNKQGLAQIKLNSVVDNQFDDNLYGKDVDREFRFENDDLKILSPTETAKQNIQVLGYIKRKRNQSIQGIQR